MNCFLEKRRQRIVPNYIRFVEIVTSIYRKIITNLPTTNINKINLANCMSQYRLAVGSGPITKLLDIMKLMLYAL
ncbi:hypothetical protein B5X24_HaOG207156 [Helicoverpa armigera]|uniref:Uncharacterized protein n=1 Tax=Helicoverpa armigera TaxID=29058 RepID=A0A2W1BST0_HELAM|nr:hypothetical protein B5X24_HaOG207156 [Helicoverpa armigera]